MATQQPILHDAVRGLILVTVSGLRIGRDPRNDLVLDNAQVSRRHAFILHIQGQLAIHDEHSTNGTFVNNKRVHGTAVLRPGDAISIGGHLLNVESQLSLSVVPLAPHRRRRRLAVGRVNAVFVFFGVATAVLVGVLVRSALPGTADHFVLPTPVAALSPDVHRTVASSSTPLQVPSAPGWADVFEQTAPNVVVVTNQVASASGTGFVIDPNHAVTNAHVVQGAQDVELTVLAPTGAGQPRTQTARVLNRDAAMDLAVLTLADQVGGHLSVGSINRLRVGDEVMAVGAPQGLAWTATFGRVSAFRPGTEFDLPSTLTAVQFDAAINPGNSGGPLILRDGTVVGIVAFSTRDGRGLGFALGGDPLWARVRQWIAQEQTL